MPRVVNSGQLQNVFITDEKTISPEKKIKHSTRLVLRTNGTYFSIIITIVILE